MLLSEFYQNFRQIRPRILFLGLVGHLYIGAGIIYRSREIFGIGRITARDSRPNL